MAKEGKETTEWKAYLLAVAAAVAAVTTSLLASDVIPENGVLYTILAGLGTVAGSVVSYISGRTKTKTATLQK